MNATVNTLLARGLTSGGRGFVLPSAAALKTKIAAAQARVPVPFEGIADGGVPYSREEMDLMFRKELAHELGVPLEEVEACL